MEVQEKCKSLNRLRQMHSVVYCFPEQMEEGVAVAVTDKGKTIFSSTTRVDRLVVFSVMAKAP